MLSYKICAFEACIQRGILSSSAKVKTEEYLTSYGRAVVDLSLTDDAASSPVWFRAIAIGERLPLVEYELYLLGPINKMEPSLKEIIFAVQDTLHPTDAILLRSLQDAGIARVEYVQASMDNQEFDTLFSSGSARLSKMN